MARDGCLFLGGKRCQRIVVMVYYVYFSNFVGV